MTDGPIAYVVHDGNGQIPAWRQDLVADWLRTNRINPDQVAADRPITVLPVPFQPADGGEGWLMQVAVFHQFYVGPDGSREVDYLTRKLVAFQRTVPLIAPFPATPTPADEGTAHGETEGQAAQEAPQELVRDQEQEGVSDPRQGPREGSPEQGETARNEGSTEGRAKRGDEAFPEPEEDRRQEEVGAQ